MGCGHVCLFVKLEHGCFICIRSHVVGVCCETQYCAEDKLAHTIRAQQLSVGLSQSALAPRDWEHFLAKRESFITTLIQMLAIYNITTYSSVYVTLGKWHSTDYICAFDEFQADQGGTRTLLLKIGI